MLRIFVTISSIFLTAVLGEECATPTFTNTVVLIYRTPISITGCITSESLRKNSDISYKIDRISIRNQTIPQFQEGAVTKLPDLEWIDINDNVIQTIKYGAFLNLPAVKTIALIQDGISAIVAGFIHNLPSLTEINLRFNKLKSLEQNTFKDLPHLSTVHLDHNLLESIEAGWFKNTPKLTSINLSYNKIRSIHKSSFVDIPSLEVLQIHLNEIEQIHPKAFDGLLNLKHLHLGNNRLKTLDVEFSELPNLNKLIVYFNNLTYISDEVLHNMPVSLKEFYFIPNPLQCGCYHKLDKWSVDNRVNIENNYSDYWLKCNKDNPVCVASKSGEDECLVDVDEELYEMFYKNVQFCL